MKSSLTKKNRRTPEVPLTRESSTRIEYQKTRKLDDVSRHGRLATAYQFVQQRGIFEHWEELPLKLKRAGYSPL
jgi:hypothetical protein